MGPRIRNLFFQPKKLFYKGIQSQESLVCRVLDRERSDGSCVRVYLTSGRGCSHEATRPDPGWAEGDERDMPPSRSWSASGVMITIFAVAAGACHVRGSQQFNNCIAGSAPGSWTWILAIWRVLCKRRRRGQEGRRRYRPDHTS